MKTSAFLSLFLLAAPMAASAQVIPSDEFTPAMELDQSEHTYEAPVSNFGDNSTSYSTSGQNNQNNQNNNTMSWEDSFLENSHNGNNRNNTNHSTTHSTNTTNNGPRQQTINDNRRTIYKERIQHARIPNPVGPVAPDSVPVLTIYAQRDMAGPAYGASLSIPLTGKRR